MTILANPRTSTDDWPDLGPHDLHVWHLDLDRKGAVLGLANVSTCLSEAEEHRCAQLVDPTAQAVVRLARGGLRHVLGRYLGLAPCLIEFGTTANGKPVLAGRAGASGLHFNLSHSGRRAVIAVSRAAPVGIDIEQIRAGPRLLVVGRRFFAREEADYLATLPRQDQTAAFFRIWTLKEAFIKLTGRGLSQPLDSFAIVPGPPVRLLRSDDAPEAAHWRGSCRQIGGNYICSVISADRSARPVHLAS